MLSNVVIMLGLSATFTPLMTSSLGALPPHLYSHGSAGIGTFQQVAGAAGTALFVTAMTVVAAGSIDGGATPVESVTDGVHTAFLIGAVTSFALVAILSAVRQPDQEPAQS